jgi:cytochrome c oxidase cbb3-type subunit IV
MSLESFYAIFNPIWSVIIFVTFVGILVWTFSKRDSAFDEAARLPFDEDEGSTKSPQENKHA